MRDLKLALRSLLRAPGFTLVAVVTLALGIGANTAIFTVIQGVLLDPLPYDEPDRLVRFWNTWTRFPRGSISEAEYLDFLEENQVFESIAIYRNQNRNLIPPDGEPQRAFIKSVTGQFFALLRRPALLGRTLTPEDDSPGADRVAVASYGFWQRAWGGRESAVGSTVDLEGERYTVVGVMPEGFSYPDKRTDLWTAARVDPANLPNRGAHNYQGIARLEDGVTLEQARADVAAIARRLQERYPESYPEESGYSAVVVPLFDHTVGQVRPALVVLMGAVGLVLLLACANVANLTLVRATDREKELRLRAALGAGRMQLTKGLLAESTLVAGLGMILGLGIAHASVRALRTLGPDAVPRLGETAIDGRVLALTILIASLTVVLVGLVPALRVSRADAIVHESSRASRGGPRESRLRSALVVVQVSIAVLLLAGAGLLIRSFRELTRIAPGFRPERVIAMEVSAGRDRYPEGEQRSRFFRDVVREVESLPGVVAAGATTNPPLSGWSNDNYVEIEGYVPEAGYASEEVRGVTSRYFAAMGIPLLQGETFTGRETEDDAPVVIVNEAFARKYWEGENPIGKRLRRYEQPWATVIGVVGDVRHVGLSEPIRPTYYFPVPWLPWSTMTVVARTDGEPETMSGSLRQAVTRVDPAQPVFNVRLYEQFVADSVATPRFNMWLLLVFAAVAVTLAAVGIYGVLAYAVGARIHEIGIRMALGARASDVPWLVLRQGLLMVGLGLGIGLAGAFAVSRVMDSLLFGISGRDPVTLVAVAVVLATVAVVACVAPAWRAARVDPMVALRYE